MERKDRGMYIGGIVSLSLGGIAVAAGTAVVILNTDSEEYCVPGTGNCWDVDDDEGVAAGAGVLGLGVALLIAGSVLTVIGGERVPLSSIVDGGSKPPQLSITPTFGGVHATLDF